MEIAEPTLLAKLPRAGTSEEGSRKLSQVYGVRDGKTRKRNEVCAAIDGNSINVFEVVNGRNIASWPIPPDASFVSLPYSERKYIDNTNFVRKCWCVVKRKAQTAIHYYEHVKAGNSTQSITLTHALQKPASPVIKIGHVDTRDRQIVFAQDDGSITCLSSEGGVTSRRYQMGQDSAILRFHTIQSMSLTEAQTSVLKGRPDIGTPLTNESIVVSAVYSHLESSAGANQGLLFGVWVITISDEPQGLREPIISYDLQTSSEAVPQFKSGGSKLQLQAANVVKMFDLTTAAVQKYSERKASTSEQTSTIDLSHDIVLSSSSGELRLYNSKFNALLATRRIGNAPLKRKRDGLGLARLSFICYFSQLKRVLAYSGSQLLAIDIHIKDTTQDPFKQSTLLSGNILMGQMNPTSISQATAAGTPDGHDLQSLSRKLDEVSKSQDASEFERILTESLKIGQWEDIKKLNPHQRQFVILNMFSLQSENEEGGLRLKLKIVPTRLLKWCIKSGLLDDQTIPKALGVDLEMPLNAVANCFRQVSEDLALLEEYIRDSPCIRPAALAQIIKMLIDQALTTTLENATTYPTTRDVAGRSEARNLGHVSDGTSIGSQHATNFLIHALQRLAFAGSATVSEQIRMTFEQKEVLALIQFLRQQLFLGGYTRLAEVRNYPSPPPSEATEGGPSPIQRCKISLDGIVTLLNGCIDSLGIVGIIGSNEDQVFIERMIPELCSEIDSATAAVEDSTYLQGLLRESLRYAESVERQPFEVHSKVEKSHDIDGKKGKIMTLYTEGDTADMGNQLPTALPLSLKAEEDLSKRKIRKGGQSQARSMREMGMLKDRLKTPYAFERLVL